MDHLQNKLILSLLKCASAVQSLTEQNVRGFGLTLSEFAVLEALFHKGDMPVQKLSRTILVTSGSMTYIVKKLEAKGYVSRRQCQKDGRVWYVALTEKGLAYMGRIFPEHERFLSALLADISRKDKKELIRRLGGVRRCMKQFSTGKPSVNKN